MRTVSLNARTSHVDQFTAEVEVALFVIEHVSLDAPIRLSTDPTERLSVEPLAYGTRSTWMTSNPATEPFQYILMSAEVPGDLEDAPAAATIVVSNVDKRLADVLRSFTDRAVVHMALVLASSPDVIELEYRDLRLISAEGNAGELSLQLSRSPIEDETVPMDRFTKDRFPGLFK